MVYCLSVYIKYNNDTDRDTLKNHFPLASDPRVVSRLHEQPDNSIIGGVNIITGRIRYKTLDSLNEGRSALKGLNGTWARSSSGSYIKGHNCYHDENPSRPCTSKDIFEDVI